MGGSGVSRSSSEVLLKLFIVHGPVVICCDVVIDVILLPLVYFLVGCRSKNAKTKKSTVDDFFVRKPDTDGESDFDVSGS